MKKTQVAVIMGSESDLPIMSDAISVLKEFGVTYECEIVSAHRTPDFMARYAKKAHTRGIRIIIAGAGGAAHLPGMVASHSFLPVIGVPIHVERMKLKGLDALLSIAQMPAGVPVAAVGVDNARNAGLLAVSILALSSKPLAKRLETFRFQQKKRVSAARAKIRNYRT